MLFRPVPGKREFSEGHKDEPPVFRPKILEQCLLTDMADRDIRSWVIGLSRLLRRFAILPSPGRAWPTLLYLYSSNCQMVKTIWSRQTSLHVRWHDPKLDALQEVYRSLSHSVYEPVLLHVSMSLHSSYFVSITHVWMTERLITDLPEGRSPVALGRPEQSHIQGLRHYLVIW
jgi:hypothetical protein